MPMNIPDPRGVPTHDDRLWAKAPKESEPGKPRAGTRHVFCKDCQTQWYAKPSDTGTANCWLCGVEIQLVWIQGMRGWYTPGAGSSSAL